MNQLRKSDLLFIICALGFFSLALIQYNGTFILFLLSELLIGIILLIILFYTILKEYRSKEESNFRRALVMLVSIIFLQFFQYAIFKDFFNPIFIEAHSKYTFSGVSFYLYKDNTYKIEQNSLAGSNIFRNQYILKNDTLKFIEGNFKIYPTLIFYKTRLNDREVFMPILLNDSIKKCYWPIISKK